MSVAVLKNVTNCDSQDQVKGHEGPAAVIWDFDANLTSEIYKDLGVGELEDPEIKPGPAKKKAKNTEKRNPKEKSSASLATPSPSSVRTSANVHVHNGKKCSCIRRILNSGEQIDHFSFLPDEVVLQIFRWFTRKTLLHCAKVCKRWRRLAYDDELWRRVDLSSRMFAPGILGMILERGVVHAKLSRCTVGAPVFSDNLDQSLIVDDEDDHEKMSQSLTHSDQLQLESLDLSGCIVDDPSCIETILSKTSSLRHLSLESCHLQGGELSKLAPKLSSLQILNIAMCRLTTTEGLPAVLAESQQLKSLNMSWINLSIADLQSIIPNLAPSIQHLNISGYREKLKDADVLTLVKRCPRLQELDLSDCTVLTQASVSAITENLSSLQHVALSRCYDIPLYSYLSLEMIPSMKALEVFGALVPRQVERLKSQLTKMTINSFPFSSIARPTCDPKQPRHIWGEYCDV